MQQRPDCRGSVGRGDETLPDQHRVRSRLMKSLDVAGAEYPALRDDDRIVRASGARRSLTPRSTAKLLRSRLLIPTTLAPTAAARSISRSSWTSTSASIPQSVAAARSSASAASSSAATINSTASAPCARASTIWYGVDDEVLAQDRNGPRPGVGDTGGGVEIGRLPWKNGSSVSTEIAAAPPAI